MDEPTPEPYEPELGVGERMRIRQGKRPIPDLIGRIGTIVEVFREPLGSCLVRIDNDTDHFREWFLYRDELAAIDE